jgi:hypothetical protein
MKPTNTLAYNLTILLVTVSLQTFELTPQQY